MNRTCTSSSQINSHSCERHQTNIGHRLFVSGPGWFVCCLWLGVVLACGTILEVDVQPDEQLTTVRTLLLLRQQRPFQTAYNQFSDLAYTEAGEQHRATKFSGQILLFLLSQSSKFQVLLHFANIIASRHSQAIT